MAKKLTIAGIDVGTTKICSCIGEVQESGIEVIGVGWSPSRGLKKGVVINLSETIRSVKESLVAAEEEAGKVVDSAFISVGGRCRLSAIISTLKPGCTKAVSSKPGLRQGPSRTVVDWALQMWMM